MDKPACFHYYYTINSSAVNNLFFDRIQPRFEFSIILALWHPGVCLSYTSRLAALAETSTRRSATKRKTAVQSRAVAESPAEPLGRTSAITLGGFLDSFRFWPFVGAPPCGIVSPRISTISLRVRFVRTIIKSGQPRQLTNLIPMCYPVYAPWKL